LKNFTTNRHKPKNGFLFCSCGLWLIFLFLFCFNSCTKASVDKEPVLVTWSGAYPSAIVRTGNSPIWFQLTERGPVHIETIEEAAQVDALVPWPHAVHVRFFAQTDDGVIMTVNRDGFMKITPNSGKERGYALYRFPGGENWLSFTVGGFVFYDGFPAAVLYTDDLFVTNESEQPKTRTWSFNMNSNAVFPIDIPALGQFPESDNWSIDSLRLADDGMYYLRAARRAGERPAIRLFRTSNLSRSVLDSEEITVDIFYNSFPKEKEVSHPSLPKLPEGFVYTGVGRVGGSVVASWEELEDFSIGAAGFVVIRR